MGINLLITLGNGGHNEPCLYFGYHKKQVLNFFYFYTIHLIVQKIFLIFIFPF